jgi:hypothetical protein
VEVVLRQIDWSLRLHPAAAATRRHLHLARLVTADIDRGPARWILSPAMQIRAPIQSVL